MNLKAGPEKLTEAQMKIVIEPPEARVLLIAGAGTGKTHVLIQRVAEMVSVTPAEEPPRVSLLTFTRAAAREMRERIISEGGKAQFIRSSTLDVFARSLVRTEDEDSELASEDFDIWIETATSLLNEEAPEILPQLKNTGHIFIDEIQDLVGVRLTMVKALLSRVDCGFTLAGDPAQGIYGFQEHGFGTAETGTATNISKSGHGNGPTSPRQTATSRKTDEQDLFLWFKETFRENSREFVLEENFRAKSRQAETAIWAGTALRRSRPDYRSIYLGLDEQLCKSTEIQSVPLKGMGMFRGIEGSAAILSRTNCESLLISEELYGKGVPHNIRLRSSERGLMPWIGILLQGLNHAVITEPVYQSRYEQLMEMGFSDFPEQDDAWRKLKFLSRSQNNTIKTADISSNLINMSYPIEELTETEGSDLIVSTIHAAKGLEFNRVFVTPMDSKYVDRAQYNEMAKLLFVAMTRTRDQLWFMEKPDIRKHFMKYGRWVKGGERWNTIGGLEIRPGDIDPDRHPFLYQNEIQSIDEWERQLVESISLGDPLSLIFEGKPVEPDQDAVYRLTHEKSGMVLGFTKPAFGKMLNLLVGGKNYRNPRHAGFFRVPYPDVIRGLRFEGFDTVAVNPAQLNASILGNAGVWTRPRAIGLATWGKEHTGQTEK